MVKVMFLLRFRPDRDPEAVREWWKSEHGALALKNLGMRRYVQNHWVAPLEHDRAPGGNEFQGCVEVWFDDMDAYRATMASPEWRALEADGVNGFDMTALQGGFVDEYIMRWDASLDGRLYTASGGAQPAPQG
jgi:uncharacterized protein (TIGR02118 family)